VVGGRSPKRRSIAGLLVGNIWQVTNSGLTRLPREQRRAQLLEAASAVFAARGYHTASMDDIANAAEISKPVLYQHFDSKLELYLALLDGACEQLVDVLGQALASTGDNAERVVATMNAFYELVSSQQPGFRLIFESDVVGESAVAERIWQVNNRLADQIAEMIAADTGLGWEQAKLLGISLVGIGTVSARYWVTAGQPVPSAEASELVGNLAWRGISGYPRTEDSGHESHEPHKT
jgi:AcrR family transcriptional regulator